MILQTTGGFSRKSFPEELFPLGTWCTDGNVRPSRTAQDLPSSDDFDVELESVRLVQILEDSLYPAMNSLHGVAFPNSYWRHTLGTYFRMLVPLLIHRYNLIRRARDHAGCDKFTSAQTPEKASVPPDRRSIVFTANTHAWNQEVMTALCIALQLEPVRQTPEPQLAQDLPTPTNQDSRPWCKRFLVPVINFIATRSDFLITRTMLPKSIELKLAIRHFTLPLQWNEDFSSTLEIALNDRRSLVSFLPSTSVFDDAILRTATLQIPRLFIEDYARARRHAQMKLPRRPSVVFTSNLHHASDVFLLWIAEAQTKGTQLVIAQHGGVHSLCRDVPGDIESERVQADRYITWGQPLFDSTTAVAGPTLVNVGAKKTTRRTYSSGPLLLVLDSSYRYPSVPRGMNGSRFAYAEFLNSFITGLDPDVVNEIIVRPYPGSELFDDPLTPLLYTDSRITVDDCRSPIQDLMTKSRIVVTTALGTTFFQALHHRIPAVLLLEPELSPISPRVIGPFEIMKRISVFFSSPQDLANHMNINFNSIEKWWLDGQIQHRIADFEKALSPTVLFPVTFYSQQLQQVRRMAST